MKRTQCRLSLADKFYGGGGGSPLGSQVEGPGAVPSGTIMYRTPDYEQGILNKWNTNEQQQLGGFTQNNPLFNAAQSNALDFNKGFPDLMKQLAGYQTQLGGYQDQLAKNQGTLGGLFNQAGSGLSTVNPIVASGGALTGSMQRDATQQARSLAPSGSLLNAGSLASEALNRDQYRQQRFNTALQQQQGILGQQAGLTGQQSALTGMGANITGQRAGITGQGQTMQSNLLNQLSGTANQAISGYTGLMNPIKSYLGNLFSGNQNASIQGASIANQANQASDSKTAGGVSGIISTIAPILMMAFMSDKRLKEKIRKTGQVTPEGLPIKTFEYKTRPGVKFTGVMAQDVEKLFPEEVHTEPLSGLKMVGVRFAPREINKKE